MPNKNPPHQSPREAARAFEVLVGRNIQKYRLKKNLTQRQLGEALETVTRGLFRLRSS